jgi:hypothetical protein
MNIIPHPSSEALAILAALRALKVVTTAQQGVAVHDEDVLRYRAWIAVDALLDQSVRMLCDRAGMVAS